MHLFATSKKKQKTFGKAPGKNRPEEDTFKSIQNRDDGDGPTNGKSTFPGNQFDATGSSTPNSHGGYGEGVTGTTICKNAPRGGDQPSGTKGGRTPNSTSRKAGSGGSRGSSGERSGARRSTFINGYVFSGEETDETTTGRNASSRGRNNQSASDEMANPPSSRGRGHVECSHGVIGSSQGSGQYGFSPRSMKYRVGPSAVVGGGRHGRRGGHEERRGRGGKVRSSGCDADSGVRMTEGMVLFWKEPACFVQWTPSLFRVDGILYCNAEQWMMANKANLFHDREIWHRILKTTDPREQKALGRQVRGFDAAVWDEKGYDVVVRGNLEKFRQNPEFREELLATGDRILAEASPYDNEWGIGLHADSPDALDQASWRGRNKLGEALMDVRCILRDEAFRQNGASAGCSGASGAGRVVGESDWEMFSDDETTSGGQHRQQRK